MSLAVGVKNRPQNGVPKSDVSRRLLLPEIVLVLAGLGQVFTINAGGRLIGSEVVLLTVLPFLLVRHGRKLLSTEPKQFLLLAGLWFCGAVLTDMIRETPFDDLSRGWSKIAFLVVNFVSIYLLVDLKPRRILILLSAIFIGGVVRLRFFPSSEAGAEAFGADIFGNAWRFGYGQAFTFFSFLIGVWLGSVSHRSSGRILQLSAAAIDLVLQARNLFGIAALSVLTSMLLSRKAATPTRSNLQVLMSIAGLLLAGWMILVAYEYAAMDGLLGKEAQEKYLKQSSGSFGLILGGRAESIASTQAILDSPIIGHGSWARDTYYVMLKVQLLEEAGYKQEGNPFQTDLIPTHSMLLGAWVEAGVLGAVFWFWCLILGLRAVLTTLTHNSFFLPVTLLILLFLLWDIAFSPLGLDRRFVEPAYLCLAILVGRKLI